MTLARLFIANLGYRFVEWADATRDEYLMQWIERIWL